MKRAVLPIVVFVVGTIIALVFVKSKGEVEMRAPEVTAPMVRTQVIARQTHEYHVSAQGTVSPRTSGTLVAEVAGRITSVSEDFASGGFFEVGDALVTIANEDYEAAAARASAEVATREYQLAREIEEAEIARLEWERVAEDDAPSPLVTRGPQLANAKAQLAAAQAGLEKAERDLSRTKVRAPYTGRIRSKLVDVGGYVVPGTPVADIYAVDVAEIRLPLPDQELGYLDVPLHYRGESAAPGSTVEVSATFAGRKHTWSATIVRTEGEIDARTRMVHLVAQVNDPQGRGDDRDRPPLAVGLFVDADITGRTVPDVALLPRAALRPDGTILVVDDESKLRRRHVEILRYEGDRIVVGEGISEGERVCVSPLETVIDGMLVRVFDEDQLREPGGETP